MSRRKIYSLLKRSLLSNLIRNRAKRFENFFLLRGRLSSTTPVAFWPNT